MKNKRKGVYLMLGGWNTGYTPRMHDSDLNHIRNIFFHTFRSRSSVESCGAPAAANAPFARPGKGLSGARLRIITGLSGRDRLSDSI